MNTQNMYIFWQQTTSPNGKARPFESTHFEGTFQIAPKPTNGPNPDNSTTLYTKDVHNRLPHVKRTVYF